MLLFVELQLSEKSFSSIQSADGGNGDLTHFRLRDLGTPAGDLSASLPRWATGRHPFLISLTQSI